MRVTVYEGGTSEQVSWVNGAVDRTYDVGIGTSICAVSNRRRKNRVSLTIFQGSVDRTKEPDQQHLEHALNRLAVDVYETQCLGNEAQ